MKKIFFIIASTVFSLGTYAQLNITSEGNAILGHRLFNNGVKLNISEDDTNFTTEKFNIYSRIDKLSSYYNCGISSIVARNTSYPVQAYPRAIAMFGSAKGSPAGRNFGVVGNLAAGEGAGIYGTIGASVNFLLDGSYAGYFDGETEVDGNLYASNFLTSSDIRLKENIEYLGDRSQGISTLENMMRLNVIKFNYKRREASKETSESLDKETAEMLGLAETDEKMEERQEKLHEQKHYGLSAQELREIYPDLVVEKQNGYLTVNYVELVPLLLQCIQEMQQEIDELKGEGTEMKAKANGSIGEATGVKATAGKKNVLFQNTPNPFKEQTVIRFSLAEDVKNASVCIFDMQGKMLQSHPVQAGMESITVNGYELGAGMFLYSLVVNGQEMDTKKMILSK